MTNIMNLIQKYGKQFIEELLDLTVINNRIDNNHLRKLLLKYKIIKPSTKIIINNLYKRKTDNNNIQYSLYIYNGRSQEILCLSLNQSNLPEVFTMLNNSN